VNTKNNRIIQRLEVVGFISRFMDGENKLFRLILGRKFILRRLELTRRRDMIRTRFLESAESHLCVKNVERQNSSSELFSKMQIYFKFHESAVIS